MRNCVLAMLIWISSVAPPHREREMSRAAVAIHKAPTSPPAAGAALAEVINTNTNRSILVDIQEIHVCSGVCVSSQHDKALAALRGLRDAALVIANHTPFPLCTTF